eukprot:TRINITY_DN4117_c0_g1_i1.p1 TRINITY_DN4117_c0_g1~~TRINITY_DN4117_c0_g1_i1.p1  ORF type:complete len:983 (+),score=292.03 TRINITY_DN4117_c0_g1_i1:160-3108(+)
MTGTKGSGNNKKKKKAAAVNRPAGTGTGAVPVSAAAPPRVSSGASAVPTVPIVSPAGGAAALSAGSAPPPSRAAGSGAATGGSAPTASAKADAKADELDTPLKKASGLKEEGNELFNAKKYAEALATYSAAIKLVPQGHKDRAVLHSNRAACLLLVKPVAYDMVITECTLALSCNPRFTKALIRRARAYEALHQWGRAEEDAKGLLQIDPKSNDALLILSRVEAHRASVAKKKAAAAARANELGARGNEKGGRDEVPVEDTNGQNQYPLNDVMLGLVDLVRARIGFDPMILEDSSPADVNRAVEEAMTSEDAGTIFEQADAKFAQMAATLFISWGNLYRIMAERRTNPKKPSVVKATDSADATQTPAGEQAAVKIEEIPSTGEKPNAPSTEETAAEAKSDDKKAAVEDDAKEEAKTDANVGDSSSASKPEGGKEEGGDAKEASTTKDADSTAAAAAAEPESEEERLKREVEDCKWALLKMEDAMRKFEDAISLQPGMVDGLTGVAQCHSDRARLAVRQAELAMKVPDSSDVQVSHKLAVQVRKDYEASLAKFNSADEILGKFEAELREQLANPHLHPHHCNNPEHHHHAPPPPPPAPANGEPAPPRPLTPEEEEEQLSRAQQIENVVMFRRGMVLNWLSAVTAAAGFEYLLGEEDSVKANLELTNKIMTRVSTFGANDISQADAAIKALPPALRQLRSQLAASQPADVTSPAVSGTDDKAADKDAEVAAAASSASASDDKTAAPVAEKSPAADGVVADVASTDSKATPEDADVAATKADDVAAEEESAEKTKARQKWLEVWAKGQAEKKAEEEKTSAAAAESAVSATEAATAEGEEKKASDAPPEPEVKASATAKGEAASATKEGEAANANGGGTKGGRKKKGGKDAAVGKEAAKDGGAKGGPKKTGGKETGGSKEASGKGGAKEVSEGTANAPPAAPGVVIDTTRPEPTSDGKGQDHPEEAMTPVKDLVGKFLALAKLGGK